MNCADTTHPLEVEMCGGIAHIRCPKCVKARSWRRVRFKIRVFLCGILARHGNYCVSKAEKMLLKRM